MKRRLLCGLRLALPFALVICLGQAAFAANLVTNGGFETGSFTGWTQSGNTSFTGVVNAPVHSGSFAASFGPEGSLGFIDQILATVPGVKYTISFWLQNDGGTPNEFQSLFDGVIHADLLNFPGQPYTFMSYDAVASGSSTDLKFGFRSDPAFIHIDDISVTPNTVPEPSTMVLLGLGVLGVASLRRRRA